ncbi:MAG: hypothetical protein Q8J78_17610 [Moraxellaceae bacterium]|nr:hypothetical protein [Moraxellaceae bacterium]
MPSGTDTPDNPTRLYLRASIKLLVTVGLLFMLVPFFKSLPWPSRALPAGSVLVTATELADGRSIAVTLAGETVWVTRNSDALRARLLALHDKVWMPNAPQLLDAPFFVVSGRDNEGRLLRFRAADGAWPGGLLNEAGHAFDVSGRALKPGPHFPEGSTMKTTNLESRPFQPRDGGVLLVPPTEVLPVKTPSRF